MILISDDCQSNLKVLSETLKKFGYDTLETKNGKMAVKLALGEGPDMVLLDIHMPEMDGYEVCKLLKENPISKDIPVMFVSGLMEPFNKLKAFELGAVDYMTKPIQLEEIRARIEVHLEVRQKVKELEEFNKVMLHREMRIVELKKEVNLLASDLKIDVPYPETWKEKN